jgi:transitional endoplasmic reticulum ATPase
MYPFKRHSRMKIAPCARPMRKPGFVEKKKLTYLLNILAYGKSFFHESLFDQALDYMTVSQKKQMVKDSLARLIKIKTAANELESLKSHCKVEGVDDALKPLYRHEFLKRRIFREIFDLLKARLCKDAVNDEVLPGKLDEIGTIFNMNQAELEMLLLFYLINTDSVVDRLHDAINERLNVRTYLGITMRNKWPVAIMTGFKKTDVDKALSKSSTIIRSYLINDDLLIPSEIVGFLEGAEDTPISNRYFRNFIGQAVPLDCHTIDKKHIEMVRTIVRHKPRDQGVNVLLYGEPGTGKTEFARSLGQSLGLSIYEINNLDEESEKEKGVNYFRFRALLACQRIVAVSTSLILIDEADTLLNSVPAFFSIGPAAEKGQINRVLDDSKAFVIWITNRYDGIDDSTKRRFDYSIGFEKMTFSQRRAVWQHGLAKYKLAKCLGDSEIESLASDYEINAGGIDVALRNAARVYEKTGKKKAVPEIIRTLLRAHLTILDQDKTLIDTKKPNAPDYSLEGLNIRGDVSGTVSIIEKFNGYWAAMDENAEIRNMNLLLYGPPGSGKTEFAKFTARTMNRRLIVKRASDLLNCYLGETEKLIKRAFSEAECDKAILFIDEADSLLGNREGAAHSWEVSHVNELLTNMETLRGMLICATNFKKIVDSAAMRRFNIKLEFDYLKPEGTSIFYNLFCGKLVPVPMTGQESASLGSIAGLTPGDFKVIYQKFSFFDKKELSHGRLIEALRQELRAKDAKYGKTMGFGA